MSDFDVYVDIMQRARCPEDVFGTLGSDPHETIKIRFQRFARVLHPDAANGNESIATEAMARLGDWREQALQRIAARTYGNRYVATLKSKVTEYALFGSPVVGGLTQVYDCEDRHKISLIAKVTRDPRNNDLVLNEAKTLKFLRVESPAKDQPVMAHIPELVDTFEIKEGGFSRRINIIKRLVGYYTLADVLRTYQDGLDLRDAAWMFNRLLSALVATHEGGVIHGAIIPEHVLICPKNHNGVLIDWSYSTRKGGRIKAICPSRRAYYAPEVLVKGAVDTGTDIYQAAMCLIALLGGDVDTQKIPDNVPRMMRGLIRACLFANKGHRSSDAFLLHKEFTEVLEALYGPRKYRPFEMVKGI